MVTAGVNVTTLMRIGYLLNQGINIANLDPEGIFKQDV